MITEETSREAYEEIKSDGSELAWRVRLLEFYKRIHPRAVTDREAEHELGATKESNIRTRRKTLQTLGLISPTGRKRRSVIDGHEEGKKATEWVYDPHVPTPKPEASRCPLCKGTGRVHHKTDDEGQFDLF